MKNTAGNSAMKPNHEIVDIACRYIKQRVGDKSPTDASCLLLAIMEKVLGDSDDENPATKAVATEVAYLLFFLSISTSTRKGLTRWSSLMSNVTMAETPAIRNEPKFLAEMRKHGSDMRNEYYDLLKRASAG
ncbi:MAG: hypothetical protein EBZ78_02205 [Verrucomicrobia bacterium]|nr:hypothetical protein [Verrucomicrobiota bacterium]